MNSRTPNSDRDAALLAGDVAPLSQSAAGVTAKILFFPVRSAAAYADLEDATELDDSWESVGSVAVRLTADWSLPRLLVFSATGAGEEEQHR